MIVDPTAVAPKVGSAYPPEFQAGIQGRVKRKIGDALGLKNFGVNWVVLAPGAASALRHWHEQQDEFVYVVSGALTLITDEGETILSAGSMAGFPAGNANGHHLINRSDTPATYLEVGDRSSPEHVHYPDNNLKGRYQHGTWHFSRKTGADCPES